MLKNIEIEQSLEKLILSPSRKAHEKLPSENEIAEKYHASVALVRQVFARLVAKGLIYRKRGSGTYVSPKPRNAMLLLVHEDIDVSQHPHTSPLFFYLSQAWSKYPTAGAVFCMAKTEFSLLEVSDLLSMFPYLSGILFFRVMTPNQIPGLDKLNLPLAFLGSSIHRETVAIPGRYHEEKEIAKLIKNIFKNKNILVIGAEDLSIHSRRAEILVTELEAKALYKYSDAAGRDLLTVLKKNKCDAVVAVYDELAIQAIGQLRANGIDVPNEVAICGINGDYVGRITQPKLTSILIDLKEDAEKLIEWFMAPKNLFPKTGSISILKGESA
jgi:hypothetical protein